MKRKIDRIFLIQILYFFIFILINIFMTYQVFAIESEHEFIVMELSQQYLKYLNLSDDEKSNAIMPRMYEISKSNSKKSNPLKLARMLGTSLTIDYTLQTVIPENMIIKNQQNTKSCWTFSSLAALETNLALKDKKENKTPVIYDFSERHMEYSTSQSLLDDETNEKIINDKGFNRNVGDGGNHNLYIPYLTNGTGAIHEEDMKFKNDENPIYISEIRDKKVITQVNDIIFFPAYNFEDDKTEIMQQMKEHIKNYGAIDAGIYGANLSSDYYNNQTGAIYCNDNSNYQINHSVAIIGWDEDYPITNFAEKNQPTNPGAWLVKNSWGENAGDNGIMYVSYEDANIYLQLNGIVSAQNEIEYENIYQYDEFGGMYYFGLKNTSKLYLATEFNRKTKTDEYLTQVSITVPQETNCKVYVNLNGASKETKDLKHVQLKSGESETISAGYHTLEFAEPLKINSETFVVVIETTATSNNTINTFLECKYRENIEEESIWDNVIVESNKCFYAKEKSFLSNKWTDTSTLFTKSKGTVLNGDITIKAFTTSKILEDIFISDPPSKTEYVVGQDFDSTNMVIKAKYVNGDLEEIKDYVLINNKDLGLNQESVTISYKGKNITQKIEVVENTLESIKIVSSPQNTEYWAGEEFDSTGIVIAAIYKNGDEELITEGYVIKNGPILENGQESITIEYKEKTVTQKITVKANTVEEIEILKNPIKTDYIVGQNFNPKGIVIQVTYAKGNVQNITEGYTVNNGQNLQINQNEIEIEYEEKTAIQKITVEDKKISLIKIINKPSKTEYIQTKEQLDLTGGLIEVKYNDNSTEEISMNSQDITVTGFNNQNIGKQTLILTYKNESIEFEVEVKELEKPKHSDLKNIKANVAGVKVNISSKDNNDEIILKIELSDINIDDINKNDANEYYYYISPRSTDENITDWIKIKDLQISEEGKYTFNINTRDFTKEDEKEQLLNANNLYLYIKEVVTKNNIKTELQTSSIILNVDIERIKAEGYVNDNKKVEIEAGEIQKSQSTEKFNKDDTIVEGIIPNAGKRLLTLLMLLLCVILISRIIYLKYKDIKIK